MATIEVTVRTKRRFDIWCKRIGMTPDHALATWLDLEDELDRQQGVTAEGKEVEDEDGRNRTHQHR